MVNKTCYYPKAKLKNYLKNKKISYIQLETLTGINYSEISHMITGYKDVKLSDILKISDALKLEPVEVFNLLLEE